VSWGSLLIHCPACDKVRRPRLTAGASLVTLPATCPECHTFLKQVPKALAERAEREAYRSRGDHAKS